MPGWTPVSRTWIGRLLKLVSGAELGVPNAEIARRLGIGRMSRYNYLK